MRADLPTRALPPCLGLAGVLVSLLSLQAGAADHLTPQQVARLRVVTEVALAPDAHWIAYTLAVPRQVGKDDDGPAWSELHVVDTEGRDRAFIAGEVNVSALAITADSRAIHFLSKRGKDKHTSLYSIPIDGGEARKLLETDEDIRSYDWSHDGKRLAFLALEGRLDAQTKLRDKGFTQEVFEEDARPVRVWIADSADGIPGKPRKLNLEGSASELAWSPEGTKLSVALAPTPGVDDDYMRRVVHIVDLDGKVLGRVDREGKLGKVVWSPDGAHLALIAGQDVHDPAPGRLLVAESSGGVPLDVLPGFKGHVTDLAWQDANTLLALGDEGAQTSLFGVGREGGGRAILRPASAGDDVFTRFVLAPDGHPGALIGESPRFPSEVFLWDAGGGAPRRLTNSNPWLADIAFTPQEVVRFKARDGLELEGILVHPADEKPGQRYPLILSVHGGPESHERNGWQTTYSKPGQVAAGRGFAVLSPNYRGSTGRGVEFSELSQGDPAGKEFDDLVDAVEYMVGSGLVDRAKVGITGGSYGGYATAWGATALSDHFAAAVMMVGISDKLAKAGTTDIPQEEFLVHARKRPWDDWNFFMERSPVHHVTEAHTPIIILHGKDDPRVHPSQSLELYRYLKLAGKAPVRLVWYPGEGHGNRRAASRYDYQLRMLQWFEHYLKGPGGLPPGPDIDYALGGKTPSEPATPTATKPADAPANSGQDLP